MRQLRSCLSIILLVTFIGTLYFSPVSHLFANEATYQDYSHNHTYPNDWVEQLIEVYADDDSYDQLETQKMINRIGELPDNILEEGAKQGIRLLFIDFEIPQLEELRDLDGEHPRGHAEDITWNDMLGVTRDNLSVSTIGYTYPKGYSASVQLDYHELFHSLDAYVLGEQITALDEFIVIHEAEQNELVPGDDYYQYITEYFAEAAAFYYRGGKYREHLQQKTPKTYAFFANFSNRLISAEFNKGEDVTLTWPEIEGAETYYIYRDMEYIGSTTENMYIDQTFEEAYVYSRYIVEAENKTGEKIYTSLPKLIDRMETNSVEVDNSTSVELKEITDQSITLQWSDSANAEYYEIYRDDVYVGVTYDTMYRDYVNTTNPNRTYTYTIHVLNDAETVTQYEPFTIELDKVEESMKSTSSEGLDKPNFIEEKFFHPKMIIIIILATTAALILLFIAIISILICFIVSRKKKNRSFPEKEEHKT